MGNHILLERVELNNSAASVTFANIPQSGYTDLKIVISAITTGSTQNCSIALNGSTSNFSSRQLGSDGSTPYSASRNDNLNVVLANGTGYTALVAALNEIYIPNYLSSVAKSFSTKSATENNATGADLVIRDHLWNPVTQAAISSVTIYAANGSGSFGAYSTFSLYGIAATGTIPAIAPKATGGNVVATDGTYWIHTFNTSGTFTPLTPLTCDYLVVAGGGGGNGNGNGVNQAFGGAGGGGAGGLRSTVTASGGSPGTVESAISVTAQAYTITVGAGGVGALGRASTSTNGTNSIFSTITSTGGGGVANSNGQNGGSGGGASDGGNFGTGTANQGFNGGAEIGGSGGAGGGGAGVAGTNATSDNGASGGNGVATSISGSSVTYAGGGGGSGYAFAGSTGASGGTGGGGSGSNGNNNGGAATVNTGGGGGGASQTGTSQTTGGNGGSGIVIIRYAV